MTCLDGLRFLRPLRARVAALGGATEGVAAVEFALVLPLMLTMYFGLIAVTVGINTSRKIAVVSRTIADLTGRTATVSATGTNSIESLVTAAAAVISPYDPAGLEVTVASVVVYTTTGTTLQAKVCWSAGRTFAANGTSSTMTPDASLAQDAIVTIPDGFGIANTAFIMTKVHQLYTPVVGESLTGSLHLTETTPWPVRNVQEVTYPTVRTFKDVQMGRTATGKCLT